MHATAPLFIKTETLAGFPWHRCVMSCSSKQIGLPANGVMS
jgi:hypothetical protein